MPRQSILWNRLPILLAVFAGAALAQEPGQPVGQPVASKRAIPMNAAQLGGLPLLDKMVWIRVPPCRKPPVVDGTLDLAGGEWSEATGLDGMLITKLEDCPPYLAPMEAKTYVTWDKDSFYFAMRTACLPGQRLMRNVADRDGAVYADDSYEIYLDPLGADLPEQDAYQFVVNSRGAVYDSRHPPKTNKDGAIITTKEWDGGATARTDYKPGMDHFDLEIRIPVKPMGVAANVSGQGWRFLVARNWRRLGPRSNENYGGEIFTSITGTGNGRYNQFWGGLVLDERAPVVQVLDTQGLADGKTGLLLRVRNPGDKPLSCTAAVQVFPRDPALGATEVEKDRLRKNNWGGHVDWSGRKDALAVATETFDLAPGGEKTWTLPPASLPALPKTVVACGDECAVPAAWHDLAVNVRDADGATLYRRQLPFTPVEFRLGRHDHPIRIAKHSPMTNRLAVECNTRDYPDGVQGVALRVEVYAAGAAPDKDKPLASHTVATMDNGLLAGTVALPALGPGTYPVRLSMLSAEGKPLDAVVLSIARQDEQQVQERVKRLLAAPAPKDWKPTGFTRDSYLDIMEKNVRYIGGKCVGKDGMATDVWDGKRLRPFRWVSSASILLKHGRIPDLKEKVDAAMSRLCKDLVQGDADGSGAGFWMAELTVAYDCLKGIADEKRLAEWQAAFARLDPAKLYGGDLTKDHNWVVYICAAEVLREKAGLAPGKAEVWGNALFDRYMVPQMNNMSELGLYCDPGTPMTYDITTRLKYASALALGNYAGPLRRDLDELLRRAGYATLLFTAPEGYCPYGGRSDQSNFQECMIAALCELEAKRHKESDPKLAGAFRRMAHLAALSIKRWNEGMEPPRSIKNAFPPEAKHGFDGYRRHAQDVDFVGALLGLAVLMSDDAIAEAPCPAEIGGYTFEIAPSFHKIFASCGGGYLEIDTAADTAYNGTGLGRFLMPGVPMELGPGMPIAPRARRWGSPVISMAPGCKQGPKPVAVGPVWPGAEGWTALAELSDDLTHTLSVTRESPEAVAFRVAYAHVPSKAAVTEEYVLKSGSLAIRSVVAVDGKPAKSLRFTVPLLVTDGASKSVIQGPDKGLARVEYLGHALEVRYGRDVTATLGTEELANRNGVYRVLVIEVPANEIQLSLQLR